MIRPPKLPAVPPLYCVHSRDLVSSSPSQMHAQPSPPLLRTDGRGISSCSAPVIPPTPTSGHLFAYSGPGRRPRFQNSRYQSLGMVGPPRISLQCRHGTLPSHLQPTRCRDLTAAASIEDLCWSAPPPPPRPPVLNRGSARPGQGRRWRQPRRRCHVDCSRTVPGPHARPPVRLSHNLTWHLKSFALASWFPPGATLLCSRRDG